MAIQFNASLITAHVDWQMTANWAIRTVPNSDKKPDIKAQQGTGKIQYPCKAFFADNCFFHLFIYSLQICETNSAWSGDLIFQPNFPICIQMWTKPCL